MTTYAPNYAPMAPFKHHKPLRIAEDTYLIRQLMGEGTAPFGFYVNSMVILGDEPVIVDTNTVGNRKDYLNDVFSLVAPEDVKWIFISHDDHDHVGNLPEVLDLCPNATLVSSWFQVERLAGDLSLPLHRMRWLNNGDTFKVGNHELMAVRPPTFDAPTTRALFDPRTGVYWASDCFAAPVMSAMDDSSEYNRDFWHEMFLTSNNYLSPWLTNTDPAKFGAQVDKLAALKPKVIAGAHNVTITAREIDYALAMLRELPGREESFYPDQEVLNGILSTVAGHG